MVYWNKKTKKYNKGVVQMIAIQTNNNKSTPMPKLLNVQDSKQSFFTECTLGLPPPPPPKKKKNHSASDPFWLMQ